MALRVGPYPLEGTLAYFAPGPPEGLRNPVQGVFVAVAGTDGLGIPVDPGTPIHILSGLQL
jgi:hypothetical protein